MDDTWMIIYEKSQFSSCIAAFYLEKISFSVEV